MTQLKLEQARLRSDASEPLEVAGARKTGAK